MKVLPILLAFCVALLVCFVVLQNYRGREPQPPVRLAATDQTLPLSGDQIRPPAVAGTFYPEDPQELTSLIDRALEAAGKPLIPGRLVALMVPHAGYVYSAPVAAYSYAQLKALSFDTVVVLGPCHREPVSGAVVPTATRWRTPLGEVPIDQEFAAALIAAEPRLSRSDGPHAEEHCLEVQVPFLQRSLTNFRLLPVLVSDFSLTNCAAISQALAKVAQGKKVLLIASSDMTHYPAYDDASRTDHKTLDLISSWRLRDLPGWEQQATNSGVAELHCTLCGLGPVMIVMDAARRLGANTTQVLKYANSGDAPTGDKSRCVGYGAVAFTAVEGKPSPEAPMLPTSAKPGSPGSRIKTSEGELTPQQQTELLALAREAVNTFITTREVLKPTKREGLFNEPRAVFVTLERGGRLRGCIGSLSPQEPLVDAVVSRAIAAATQDPRFPPVQKSELSDLTFHVSVLSPVRPIKDPSEIVLGKHGVIVSQGFNRGVFLPEVAPQQGWDRDTMLTYLCAEKAGLPPDAWKKGAKLEVFTTQQFGDE